MGETRRQGAELALAMRTRDVTWSASLGLVRATFQTRYQFASTANSAAEDTDGDGLGDTVSVRRGDHIPGIPERTLKLRADWDVLADLSIGAGVLYTFSVYARGDENNGDDNGKVPGYAIVEAAASYETACGAPPLRASREPVRRRLLQLRGPGRVPSSAPTRASARRWHRARRRAVPRRRCPTRCMAHPRVPD